MRTVIITSAVIMVLFTLLIASAYWLPPAPMDLNARPEYIPGVTSQF